MSLSIHEGLCYNVALVAKSPNGGRPNVLPNAEVKLSKKCHLPDTPEVNSIDGNEFWYRNRVLLRSVIDNSTLTGIWMACSSSHLQSYVIWIPGTVWIPTTPIPYIKSHTEAGKFSIGFSTPLSVLLLRYQGEYDPRSSWYKTKACAPPLSVLRIFPQPLPRM